MTFPGSDPARPARRSRPETHAQPGQAGRAGRRHRRGPAAQPATRRRYPDEAAEAQAQLRAIAPDVMVVAAYGLILPQWVLDLPRLGCLNIHASLLPRWRRGAIQRAIEAGDAQTGVTIMQMDAGLDTGDMLLERVVPIGAETNAAQLHDALAEAGGEAIVGAAGAGRRRPAGPQAARGRRDLRRQAGQGRGRAGLRAAGEPAGPPCAGVQSGARRQYPPARPGRSGEDLARRSRSRAGGRGSRQRAARRCDGIDIATGEGALRLLELQKAGGKRQPVDVFVRAGSRPEARRFHQPARPAGPGRRRTAVARASRPGWPAGCAPRPCRFHAFIFPQHHFQFQEFPSPSTRSRWMRVRPAI